MRFANPEFFYLLWAVPLLIVFMVWAGYARKRALKRLGDQELIARLTGSVSRGRRIIKNLLLILLLTFGIIALVNPQIGTRLEEVKREGVDIFIALDVSNSMLAEDVAPNRFEKARHEIRRFIDRLRGDRVGLIVFSGLSFVQCPLTLDYSAAQLFLDDLYVGLVPQPGTNLAEAIRTALKSFGEGDGQSKTLVLITDGEEHEEDPMDAAEAAAEAGLTIYTVGIGSPRGAPIPQYDNAGNRVGYKRDGEGQVVTTRLDVATLEQIADKTGGKMYIAGAGSAELDAVYEEIFSMEKKELTARQFTQYDDKFQIFLWIALGLLFLESLIGERRKTVSPGA
ncbi:MAG TPA: VWA domain-containing protein [Calditrichia bacterium]|nr:VWA domain-containing protein [Calditrichia bacterium]